METVKRHIKRDDFCTIYFLQNYKGDILNKRADIPTDLVQRYEKLMVEFEEIQNKLEDIYYEYD